MSTPETPPAGGGAPEAQSGGSQESGQGAQASAGGPDQLQGAKRRMRKLEKEIADLRAADQARKDAELSEADQLKRKLEKAEADLIQERAGSKSTLIQARFEVLATQAGAIDAEVAFVFAKQAGLFDEVEVENGKVVGVDDVITALKASRPSLFGQPASTQLGSNGGNPPGGAPGKLKPGDISKMSQDEYAKWKADLKAGKVKL